MFYESHPISLLKDVCSQNSSVAKGQWKIKDADSLMFPLPPQKKASYKYF